MSKYNKFIFKNRRISIFFLFIICINNHYYKCENTELNSMNYKYPNCIELNNGNVLIIFAEGIYIYNSELSSEISNIPYESGFSIGENDLDYITISKFNDGIIISIIKTYLYIFSSSGEYIHHIDLSDDLQGASYYSLIPHKIIENNYYYAIIYIKSSKLNIYYYYINISDKSNNIIDNLQYEHTDSSYPSYHIDYTGSTCQLMISSNTENFLTCFYEITWPNALVAISFNLDNPICQSSNRPIVYKTNESPGYFKSAINSDKTISLICYSKSGQGGRCVSYSIINNSFSEDKQYLNVCQNKPKGLHVDFFDKTKEFIFSCSNSALGLTIIKFNEDGNIIGEDNGSIDPNFEFTGTSLFSYSILFLQNYSQYTILLTCESYNPYGKYSHHFLLPEEFNPFQTKESETEENTQNLKTTIITTIPETKTTELNIIETTTIMTSIIETTNIKLSPPTTYISIIKTSSPETTNIKLSLST